MRRAEPERRVVIDTIVWLSAWLSDTGAPAHLLAALPDDAVPVFDDATFAELETRLWRPKFDRYLTMERRAELLRLARGMSHWVTVPKGIAAERVCRDPDDDKFIHVALASGCVWLVTGDADLLCLDPLDDLRIVSAGDALAQIPWLRAP